MGLWTQASEIRKQGCLCLRSLMGHCADVSVFNLLLGQPFESKSGVCMKKLIVKLIETICVLSYQG